MIKITVPATSANLGIGYDTLGMAVSLYAHIQMDRAEALTITGCPEAFRNADNMVYQAFLYALEAWGEEPFPVSIHIETEVPVCARPGLQLDFSGRRYQGCARRSPATPSPVRSS